MGRLLDRYSLPAIFVCLTLFQPIGLGLASVSTGYPLLVGLTLAMAAIYGQVVVNDAMIARYVSDRWRAQAFSARYFLGFTASGFAAPLIGVLYSQGGFTTVLLTGTAFGAVIFLSGLALYVVASAARPVIHPAE